jgi:hypothetical protein
MGEAPLSSLPNNMPFETPVSPTPGPNMEPSPSPPPPPPRPGPRPAITSEYLASGTEGCIIGPALPNLSENGSTWEEYPENVTKLYKNRDKYNKAQTNTRKIVDLLHNNSHRVHPYRYKGYMGLNIKSSMRSRCELNRNMPLLPLRMKNLGVSIMDLTRDIGSINTIKNIPFIKILIEIQKVYEQIKRLVNNRYIHGDVRETNIMIQPSDGTITLIDFGWLYPVNEFFKKYEHALGFYSNPPESLLFNDVYYNIRPYRYNDIMRLHISDFRIQPGEPDVTKITPGRAAFYKFIGNMNPCFALSILSDNQNLAIKNYIMGSGDYERNEKFDNYIKFSKKAQPFLESINLESALVDTSMYIKEEFNKHNDAKTVEVKFIKEVKDAKREAIKTIDGYAQDRRDPTTGAIIQGYRDFPKLEMYKRPLSKQIYELMVPTFDCYGLSFTMKLLIDTLYTDIDSLRNGSQVYTPEEKNKLRTALGQLRATVIEPCSNLKLRERADIYQACAQLKLIIDEYNGITAGGGHRHKTHKRRRGGRKTVRRK